MESAASSSRMDTKTRTGAHSSCNCQRSNCITRHCVCFDADHDCTEACNCNECYNLPIYIDKVKVARNKALQRNPYAFSNKEREDTVSLIVEKKKIGCQCRLTMCVTYRCKCYKANVGCQKDCRCVGCQNVHGKRGENAD